MGGRVVTNASRSLAILFQESAKIGLGWQGCLERFVFFGDPLPGNNNKLNGWQGCLERFTFFGDPLPGNNNKLNGWQGCLERFAFFGDPLPGIC